MVTAIARSRSLKGVRLTCQSKCSRSDGGLILARSKSESSPSRLPVLEPDEVRVS